MVYHHFPIYHLVRTVDEYEYMSVFSLVFLSIYVVYLFCLFLSLTRLKFEVFGHNVLNLYFCKTICLSFSPPNDDCHRQNDSDENDGTDDDDQKIEETILHQNVGVDNQRIDKIITDFKNFKFPAKI